MSNNNYDLPRRRKQKNTTQLPFNRKAKKKYPKIADFLDSLITVDMFAEATGFNRDVIKRQIGDTIVGFKIGGPAGPFLIPVEELHNFEPRKVGRRSIK